MTEETPKIKNQFSDLNPEELQKVAEQFKEVAGTQNIDIAKTFGIAEAGITDTSDPKPTVDAKTVEILQKFAESISQVGKPEDIESKNHDDPMAKKYDAIMNAQIKNQTSEIQKIDKDFPVESILSLNCDPEIKLTLLTDLATPLAGRHLQAIESFKAAFSDKKPDESTSSETTTLESKNSDAGEKGGKSTVQAAMDALSFKPDTE